MIFCVFLANVARRKFCKQCLKPRHFGYNKAVPTRESNAATRNGSATIRDVALELGVSHVTVSCALRGAGRVSPEMIQRVRETASRMGYQRNELARTMVTGKNRVIGFVTEAPTVGLEFKARVLAGLQEEASAHGFLVKVFYLPPWTPQAPATETETVQHFLGWRVSAMAMVSVHHEVMARLQAELQRHGVPVAVGDEISSESSICVTSNTRQGMRLVVEHLRDLGHHRIAFLSGNATDTAGRDRAAMFCQSMQEAGLNVPEGAIAYGHWWQTQANEVAVRQLLASKERPTAIVCAGDPAALVVIRVARALGLEVPRDLSVTGFADFSFADYCDPPLTTVSLPFEQMGGIMARRLLEVCARSSGKAQPQPQCFLPELLPTHLVERASTAPPLPRV